ncbi:MAG: cytidine deaminase [Acidobacteriota bacterium]
MVLAPATLERLVEVARRAREHAYAPYSRFHVGAAVLAVDGRVFAGCNVENSSFGLTVCAERNAVAAAVVAGAQPAAVAVVTTRDHVGPCGACRQVLAEFAPDMPVILAAHDGSDVRQVGLDELLPGAFRFAGD